MDLFNEQIKLEEEALEITKQRFEKKHNEYSQEVGVLCSMLLHKIVKSVKNECKKDIGVGAIAMNTIETFGIEESCYIALKTTLIEAKDEISLSSLCVEIGNRITQELNYRVFKNENTALYKEVVRSAYGVDTSAKKYKLINEMKHHNLYKEFSKEERAGIGLYLLNKIIEATGLVEKITRKQGKGLREITVITYTKDALKLVDKIIDNMSVLQPIHYPMIIKPRRWSGIYGGGYLTNIVKREHNLIKAKDKDAICLIQSKEKSLADVFKAINAIQETPFKINKKVLEVVKMLWEQNGDIAGLPAREVVYPAKFWNSEEERQKIIDTPEYKNVSYEYKLAKIKEKKEKSKKFTTIYKIMIADKFKDYERIYFPCLLDWRGRIYPIPQFVNPQSDDLGRSLLLFAEGKKLSQGGLRWLKIYTANCYGIDKVSFDDRVKWVDENIDRIKSFAKDPIATKWEWSEADKPFIFLACCFELAEAIDNPDFISHLPIQVDGSNNGLQHLSAILKDPVGAKATNLIDAQKPADIYQEVADVLKNLLQKDIHTLDITDEEQKKKLEYAKSLLPLITRKVVKRAVMTTPYGVTQKGIEDQFSEDLPKISKEWEVLVKNENIVRYLRAKTIEAINSVVNSAITFKEWVQECIKVFNKNNKPFYYTAPSGFVVYHKYNKTISKRISLTFEKTRYRLYLSEETGKIDTRKQILGVSPNIIHSFDASHLVKTVVSCIERGITNFCMIHDSFGTLAEDMSLMSEVLRQEFVKMYSEKDWCVYLYEQMQSQLPKAKIPTPPEALGFNISEVLKARYFFA